MLTLQFSKNVSTSYMIESGFSQVSYLLIQMLINQDIVNKGDLLMYHLTHLEIGITK